jgi:hypothetical protein
LPKKLSFAAYEEAVGAPKKLHFLTVIAVIPPNVGRLVLSCIEADLRVFNTRWKTLYEIYLRLIYKFHDLVVSSEFKISIRTLAVLIFLRFPVH